MRFTTAIAIVFLAGLASSIMGTRYGYERGYHLGFRHGVKASIEEVDRQVNAILDARQHE